MQVIPWDLRSSMMSRSRRLSSSLSAAVGSSRISSSTFLAMALAISISCCFPTPRLLMGAFRFSPPSPTFSSISWAFLWVRVQSMIPLAAFCSFPRNTFSATDMYGLKASSWWMITMPFASDCLMLWN